MTDVKYSGTRRSGAIAVLTAILLVFLTALAGCGDASTKVGDRMWGELIIAEKDTNQDRGPSVEVPTALENNLSAAEYKEGGMVGTRVTFSQVSFGQLDQIGELLADAFPNVSGPALDLTAKRSGDVVSFRGMADLQALNPAKDKISFSLQFAGPVNANNGKQTGDDSITWDLTPGDTAALTAEAHYPDPATSSFTAWSWIMGAFGLAAIVIVGALAWVYRDQTPRPGRAKSDETRSGT